MLSSPRPKCVTVVDDEGALRVLIRKALKAKGYQVEEASNGLEGALSVGRRVPDILITDLYMPLVDGVTMLAALRQASQAERVRGGKDWFSGIALICITGVIPLDHPMVQRVEELGASILTKPFLIKTLLQSIDEALERAQSRSGEYEPYEGVPGAAISL